MTTLAAARRFAADLANTQRRPFVIWLDRSTLRCFVLPIGRKPATPCEVLERVLPDVLKERIKANADIPALPEVYGECCMSGQQTPSETNS